MSNPLISLVIPTRERCDTLQYTLQTALNQKSENYEIVISDNFSQDDTKKVVDSFVDPRIKYFNTGKRVPMCTNWDFACDKARGDFIIIIGDDDGVLPGGIDFIETFMEKHPAEIYFWDKHRYTWPKDGKIAEINWTAVRQKHLSVDLGKMVRSSIRWGANDVKELPTVYHAAVSKTILDKIKKTTGKIFHSVAPDYFISFALPVFTTKEVINVGRCVTASGHSPKANSGGSPEVFEQFFKEYGGYKCDPTLSLLPISVEVCVDAILIAKELFPDFYNTIDFNYSAMWGIYRKKMGRTIIDLIKDRKRIRQYHPFHISILIYYSFAHYILSVKRKYIERKSRILRRKLSSNPLPNNILEFVNLVENYKA